MSAARAVDVLVVGLGPGGAAAARAAASAGASVIAIERKRRIGEPVQCAEFVPAPLAEHTRAAGVLAQRVARMRTWLPSGGQEISDHSGLMVDRAEFDRALAARAGEQGAELWTATRLLRLDARASIVAVARAGDVQTLKYGVLIAADGPRSPSARLLGLPALPVVHTRQYRVPLLRALHETVIWLADDYPGGYAWLFPKGEYANLGLGADTRYAIDFKDALAGLHRRLVAEGVVGREILSRTGGAIPVGGMRACLAEGNVLFVGDAAGLTHPITGAGIAPAIQSGAAAGAAAARSLRARDPRALSGYDAEMRELFQPSLQRALARRAYLAACRRMAVADDRVQRRGWIAFKEYYAYTDTFECAATANRG